MPGVPSEMRAMFEKSIVPFMGFMKDNSKNIIRRFNLFGTGESQVGEAIQDLMVEGSIPSDVIVKIREMKGIKSVTLQ